MEFPKFPKFFSLVCHFGPEIQAGQNASFVKDRIVYLNTKQNNYNCRHPVGSKSKRNNPAGVKVES